MQLFCSLSHAHKADMSLGYSPPGAEPSTYNCLTIGFWGGWCLRAVLKQQQNDMVCVHASDFITTFHSFTAMQPPHPHPSETGSVTS